MHQPSSTAFAFLTLFLPLLPQTVLSLQWPGPRATPTPSLPDADGWTPKPTAAPPAQHVAAVMGNTNLGLKAFRRQLSDVYKSPGTCGYVDGNGEYSFTCSASSACAYNSEISAFGCMYFPPPYHSNSIPSTRNCHECQHKCVRIWDELNENLFF